MNGYDVTGTAISQTEVTTESTTNNKATKTEEEKGFLKKLLSWIFK